MGADGQVDLFADRLGRDVDADLYRLEAQLLPGEILLLFEQRFHLSREPKATGKVDGPLQEGDFRETFGRGSLIHA